VTPGSLDSASAIARFQPGRLLRDHLQS